MVLEVERHAQYKYLSYPSLYSPKVNYAAPQHRPVYQNMPRAFDMPLEYHVAGMGPSFTGIAKRCTWHFGKGMSSAPKGTIWFVGRVLWGCGAGNWWRFEETGVIGLVGILRVVDLH